MTLPDECGVFGKGRWWSTPLAIVWPCALDVEGYAAAGAAVEVPRPDCPGCRRPLTFRSGYPRYVREDRTWRVWIRRAACGACATSHALLPAFLLVRRLDTVDVIGSALAKAAAGSGIRTVAAELSRPHTTVRDWSRRYRQRAPALAAGFVALAVGWGADPPPTSAWSPVRSSMEALGAAWSQARRRFGAQVASPWRFAGVVCGGKLLATATSPPWSGPAGSGFMPPVPASHTERSPP